MSLKKPGELFERKDFYKPSVDNNINNIKEEFNRVEELRKQIDSVSGSLNNSLAEVVDKNLSFLSNDYSDQLDQFNTKINNFKEEINTKVDDVKRTNQDLRTEFHIVEQRQKNLEVNKALNKLKEEVLSEVNDIVSGVLEVNSESIKRLDGKVQVVRETYKEMKILIRENINEGLLNEPPSTKTDDPLTPTEQKFATFQDLNKHYTLFLNRIQQQLSTLGGGGAVNIRDLDDVDLSTAQVNNKYLKYDSSSKKWIGADASGGGSGIGTDNVSTSTLNVVGVSTFNDDVIFTGQNTNARWDKSKSDLVLYNDTRLTLGSNEDFQMWHGGTHTFIKNTGGDLRIRGDVIKLLREDSSERYLEANVNNAVQIFYNGNEKLATNNTGITVTGTVAATAYTGDGSGLTGIVGSGSGVVVKNSGSTVGTAGTIDFGNNLSVSPIHLGIVTVTGSAGSASTEFVAAQTLTVAGVSTFSDNVNISGSNLTLGDTSSTSDDRIVIGAGSDLHIFHNALDSHIDNNTGNLVLRTNVNSDVGGNIKLMPKAGENGIIVTHDASVELYENNVKKLETTSSGINVTGDVQCSDNVIVANNVKHHGDLDTYIEFTDDQIRLLAGGKGILTVTESSVDSVVINNGGNNCDFRVEGLNDENLIFSDGSTDRVGIGSEIPTQKLDVDGNVKATTYYGDGSNLTGISAGALDSRGTTSAATGSIAQNASADITISTRGKSFSLLKVAISAPAWVVLYVDSASRSSDSSRTEGTDPAPGSGVLTEVSTTTSGASTFLMSPAVLGWNNDGTPAAQVYAKVKNKRSNSGSNAITVTLTTVKLEA